MGSLLAFLKPELLIQTFGLFGVFFVLFAESGLFFGFFLPGDSLLFTAGVLSSQGYLSFPLLVIVSFLGAVIGDNVGYWFGHTVGKKLFEKEESLFFKKHHLLDAQVFYEQHGAKTIVFARFMPFVRTFAPIVAGVANMNYGVFMRYNLFGGALWAVGLTVLGYFLGNIPIIKHNYELVILVIVFGSVLPLAIHFLIDQDKRGRVIRKVKSIFGR
ncbi:DedA family protein [Candidatus Gottesmanbacteria bacterium]|nr:DedA family protein [Candidatus Gottesmanbacteria bacterium]